MHGKSSLIYHDGKTIYKDLPNPFQAIRYHSLLIERESLPDCLEISAETKEKEIMGVRHKRFAIEGVQFHPESIMTEGARSCLETFWIWRKTIMLRRFIARLWKGMTHRGGSLPGHGDPDGGRGDDGADRSFSDRPKDERRNCRGNHRVCPIDAGEISTHSTEKQW